MANSCVVVCNVGFRDISGIKGGLEYFKIVVVICVGSIRVSV